MPSVRSPPEEPMGSELNISSAPSSEENLDNPQPGLLDHHAPGETQPSITQDRPLDPMPVEPTMEDWIDNPEVDITVSQVGGIAKTNDGQAIAFVGIDPDAC